MNNLDSPVNLVNQLIPLTAGVWTIETTHADRCLCHYEKKSLHRQTITTRLQKHKLQNIPPNQAQFQWVVLPYTHCTVPTSCCVCSMDWTRVGGQGNLSVMAFVQRIYY